MCNNCHLKQKLKPTSKHWYAQVLVQYSDDKKITLTLFEEPIKQILAIQNKAFTNNNWGNAHRQFVKSSNSKLHIQHNIQSRTEDCQKTSNLSAFLRKNFFC